MIEILHSQGLRDRDRTPGPTIRQAVHATCVAKRDEGTGRDGGNGDPPLEEVLKVRNR